MHLSSSRLTLAATDLGRFLACRHLTGLDVEVAFGERKKPPKYRRSFSRSPHRPRIRPRERVPREGEGRVVRGPRHRRYHEPAVLSLDDSILPIQGPPGAGKTYTGARMIVECVRKGLTVGVSAVSHRVIKKLLEDAVTAGKKAKPRPVALACVHKDEENRPIVPGIDDVATPKQALAAIHDGTANVVSGTAWLWARPDAVPGASTRATCRSRSCAAS